MKRFGIFWTGLRASVSSIHPVDRYLILFTVVLLAQSVYSLFAPEQTPLAGNIDTMVRTSLAAVFGYFLSAREEGTPEQRRTCHCLRAAAAAGIGLFCLATLLVLRNLALWDAGSAGGESVTATVAQFRDFISGCVGFLIGAPPPKER